MEDTRRSRAIEMLALAKNFRELAEGTTLPGYRNKLLETAARLADAANALEGDSTAQSLCT